MKTWYQFTMGLSGCVAALLMGCGGGADPIQSNLGQVTGVVKVNGTPTPGLNVTFEAEGGSSATATTDQAGRFELQYSASLKGAEIGPNKVRITGRDPQINDMILSEMAAEQGVSAEELKSKPVIPKKYNEQTELSEEVQAGKNEFEFDLQI